MRFHPSPSLATMLTHRPSLFPPLLCTTQIIEENLAWFEDDPTLWENTARAMFQDLPGWAGYFKRMEEHSEEAPMHCFGGACVPVPVHLVEFMAVHSILQRASLEAIMMKNGWDPTKQSVSSAPNAVEAGDRPLFGMGAEMQSLRNRRASPTRTRRSIRWSASRRPTTRSRARSASRRRSPPRTPTSRARPSSSTCFDEREEYSAATSRRSRTARSTSRRLASPAFSTWRSVTVPPT